MHFLNFNHTEFVAQLEVMEDSKSCKCDEQGRKVQHWIRTDQSKIYNAIEETVKSTSSTM